VKVSDSLENYPSFEEGLGFDSYRALSPIVRWRIVRARAILHGFLFDEDDDDLDWDEPIEETESASFSSLKDSLWAESADEEWDAEETWDEPGDDWFADDEEWVEPQDDESAEELIWVGLEDAEAVKKKPPVKLKPQVPVERKPKGRGKKQYKGRMRRKHSEPLEPMEAVIPLIPPDTVPDVTVVDIYETESLAEPDHFTEELPVEPEPITAVVPLIPPATIPSVPMVDIIQTEQGEPPQESNWQDLDDDFDEDFTWAERKTAKPDKSRSAEVSDEEPWVEDEGDEFVEDEETEEDLTEVILDDSMDLDEFDLHDAQESDVQKWVPAPQDPPRPRYIPPKTSPIQKFERFADASKTRTNLTVIEQLRQGLPADRMMGWIVTLVITGLAFIIRFVRLGNPTGIMFDETYYAKDGWSLLQYGYEGQWLGDADDVNPAFAQGDYSALSTMGTWVVHPPVGKWIIAAGQWMFGLNSFGWRFGALIFGTLLVFMVIRLARRLSRSTLIGGIAGLLITVDGLSFVMSRIALLDIFQAFFIVAAAACVVADRDYFRNRLADHLETLEKKTLAGKVGPFIFRPWLLGAGVMFGLACGVKWNSIYPLAIFGILVVIWSISARRLAGAKEQMWSSVISDGIPAFISMVIVGAGVYLCSWIPWLKTTGGFARDWGLQNPDSWWTQHFGEALASLYHWHDITYGFHTGEGMASAEHVYQSSPWVWPVLGRTIGIFADTNIAPGDQGCKADVGETCLRVITGLGTPLLWWCATIAIIVALIWWLAGSDWRFGVPVLGMLSTWVPWMFAGTRPMFAFYSITMIPFMVIALAMVLGVVLGPRDGPRRQSGAITVGTIVALIVLNFAFIYPILSAGLLTRSEYNWRMWLPGWV